MASTGTRSAGNKNRPATSSAAVEELEGQDQQDQEELAGLDASVSDTGDDTDLSVALDQADESSEVQKRATVEERRDSVMRDYALLAPDDYRARMRSQTHIAAAELGSDTTRPGGHIIDRRGREVDANGKPIKGKGA